MAYFLVTHEGVVHANTELYIRAVAGGERKFIKMLAEKHVVGKQVFDSVLYPVTEAQLQKCLEWVPKIQDVDEDLEKLQEVEGNYDGRTITISKALAQGLIEHRGFEFLRIRDLNQSEKYRLMPKLATTRVCGSAYVALGAVRKGVENPVVVVVSK
jgi:hypothetical protein